MNLDTDRYPRLDDEELSRQAPMVRAQLAIRYEQLWAVAETGIHNTTGDPDWRPDPRMVEAGIRILRNQATLYRLDSPAAVDREEPTGTRVGVRALVMGQLEALSARMEADAS